MTNLILLTDEEKERLGAIKARVANIPDWFPETTPGAREIRIPPNPSKAQREFIACAPEDIRWLIQQVEARREVLAPVLLATDSETQARPAPSKKK